MTSSSLRNYQQCAGAPVLAVAVVAFTGRKRRMKTLAQWAVALELLDDGDGTSWWESGDDDGPHEKLTRRVYPRPDFELAPWAVMIRDERLLDHTSREAKIFRRRFRIPFVFFLELIALVKARGWFPSSQMDVGGRKCIPVELKVLAALRVLGRGNFFDDMCESTFMSESTIQASFHRFCKHFAEELYDSHIFLPTGDAQTKVMDDYHKLGFTGAIGSTDVTHIKWDCCTYSEQRSYTGKEGYPTIVYQVTVDHTGRALAVTTGFAGAQNDKTIIRYDKAVQRIRENPRYKDRVFQLRGEDGELIDCKGAWLLVDNGYHKWRILQEPTKYPLNPEDSGYSKTLESVRKDVECFFGIVKGRFRILKLPSLYRCKTTIDNVFFACCILHNMLHAYDNMDELGEDVDWAGPDGMHDAWVKNPLTDVSSVGGGVSTEKVEVESAHDELKRKLITSFTYRKAHNDIVWLKRMR